MIPGPARKNPGPRQRQQGIYQGQSGPPIGFGNIAYHGASLRDIVADVNAGFECDPARQVASNVRTFPLRLTCLGADGFNQFDLSVFKNFQVAERLWLQLRAEAQDALNPAMFAAPNNVPTNTLFRQVTATQFPEQRRITVAAKLTW